MHYCAWDDFLRNRRYHKTSLKLHVVKQKIIAVFSRILQKFWSEFWPEKQPTSTHDIIKFWQQRKS